MEEHTFKYETTEFSEISSDTGGNRPWLSSDQNDQTMAEKYDLNASKKDATSFTITVTFSDDRNQQGTMTVTDDNGDVIATYKVLGRGSGPNHTDRLKENADTPYGTYNLTRKLESKYGQAFSLEPISGEALDAKNAGRTGLMIHGQNPETRPDMPWGTPLRPTYGCMRLTDPDIANLMNVTRNLTPTQAYVERIK